MSQKKTPPVNPDLHAAAVAMGRKGGTAKAQRLTAAERKAIGQQLAEARRKKIPPEVRKRIAKAAVAAREAKRRQGKTP